MGSTETDSVPLLLLLCVRLTRPVSPTVPLLFLGVPLSTLDTAKDSLTRVHIDTGAPPPRLPNRRVTAQTSILHKEDRTDQFCLPAILGPCPSFSSGAHSPLPRKVLVGCVHIASVLVKAKYYITSIKDFYGTFRTRLFL